MPPSSPSFSAHNSRLASLTVRELEVLALIAQGETDRLISETLVISLNTTKTHVRHILEKLGVRSRHQASDLYRTEITR